MNPKAPRMPTLSPLTESAEPDPLPKNVARRRTDYRRVRVLKRAHAKAEAPSGKRLILKFHSVTTR
jgi:hypothetical protein